MKYFIFDLETIPDFTIPETQWPQPKYGNTKDPDKKAAQRDKFNQNGGRDKVMSLDPAYCQIIAFSGLTIDTAGEEPTEEINLANGVDDKEILKKAWYAITHAGYQGIPLASFNGIAFDLPVLFFRAIANDVTVPVTLYSQLTRKYSNEIHLDLMQLLAGWDRTKWHSLDFYASRFGIESKTHSGADVLPMWKAGKLQEISDYCRQDVRVTAELFKRVYPWLVPTHNTEDIVS